MKFKTTEKAIKQNYTTIVLGYCDLQMTLNQLSPVAYTCGVYGWNADIYELTPGIAVVTGYRPFGEMRLSSEDHAAVQELEDAREYEKALETFKEIAKRMAHEKWQKIYEETRKSREA